MFPMSCFPAVSIPVTRTSPTAALPELKYTPDAAPVQAPPATKPAPAWWEQAFSALGEATVNLGKTALMAGRFVADAAVTTLAPAAAIAIQLWNQSANQPAAASQPTSPTPLPAAPTPAAQPATQSTVPAGKPASLCEYTPFQPVDPDALRGMACNLLGRAPTVRELARWNDRLEDGWGMAELQTAVSNSPEARLHRMAIEETGDVLTAIDRLFWLQEFRGGASLREIRRQMAADEKARLAALEEREQPDFADDEQVVEAVCG